jgi:hypothetical protein
MASLNPLPTADLGPYRGYLDVAPRGIYTDAACAPPRGRGAGVTVIESESGWNFLHEDLRQVQGGCRASEDDHGTSVVTAGGLAVAAARKLRSRSIYTIKGQEEIRAGGRSERL